MPRPVRLAASLAAAAVLAVPPAVVAAPVAALGLLAGFGLTRPDDTVGACADWAVSYRHARDDLATANRLWQEATRPDSFRPPDREEFRARVAELLANRPARCDMTGRLVR